MTVKDLISGLQELPEDAVVYIQGGEGDRFPVMEANLGKLLQFVKGVRVQYYPSACLDNEATHLADRHAVKVLGKVVILS